MRLLPFTCKYSGTVIFINADMVESVSPTEDYVRIAMRNGFYDVQETLKEVVDAIDPQQPAAGQGESA